MPVDCPDLIPVEAVLYQRPSCPGEWAAENYYFSAKDSATAGYWNRTRYTYSEKPLQCLVDTEVDEIVMDFATQLGKTAILNAMAMYTSHQLKRNVIIVCPDEQSAREHYDTKFEPALEQCAAFRGKLLSKSKRQKTVVDLSESWVLYAWTGSATTVSGRSAPTVLITEVNLASKKRSDEGDRIQMARDRTKGFDQRIVTVVVEGKPTIEGECRISAAYERSNREKFHVPCPICGEYQELIEGGPGEIGGLKWRKGPDGHSDPTYARQSAYYQCVHCEGDIAEQYKILMLRRGVWCPAGQEVNSDGELTGDPEMSRTISGFHLNSLYSTVKTWGDYAFEYLRAKSATQQEFRAFVNGWRCLPWRLSARRTKYDDILVHCQDYKMGQVPSKEVLALIMTVDTQGSENGFWWLVRAWGTFGSSWLVNYGFAGSFEVLDEIIGAVYRGPEGEFHRVNQVLIDSGGHRTQEVYEWCATRHPWATPIKGSHQYAQSAILRVSKIPQWNIPLWHIDAGQSRDELYDQRLAVKPGDPGYWALPSDVGQDLARGVAAWERRREKDPRTGGIRHRWHSRDEKNEHLGDCEVYQMAASYYYQFGFRDFAQAQQEEEETETGDFSTPDGRPYLITDR